MIGGDMHFGENYARTDTQASSDGAQQIDDQARYYKSVERLKPLVDRSQFAMVNLETPLSPALSDGQTGKDYVHWSDVSKSAPALGKLGIDAVGLGNNHSVDQGESGLRKTLANLGEHGIAWFGADLNLQRAQAPLLRELPRPGGGKITLAIFGMLEERPVYRNKYRFYAERGKPGVASVDVAAFKRHVAELHAAHPDLFVVAFPHWGANYAWADNDQVELGRALIDAGADIVIGQHAHTIQEIERYHGKWILYGIGNFAFLAPGRYAKFRRVQPFGLVAMLSFGSEAATPPNIRLYPFASDNRTTGYMTRPATFEEASIVLTSIDQRKKSIGFHGQLIRDDPLGPAIELRQKTPGKFW